MLLLLHVSIALVVAMYQHAYLKIDSKGKYLPGMCVIRTPHIPPLLVITDIIQALRRLGHSYTAIVFILLLPSLPQQVHAFTTMMRVAGQEKPHAMTLSPDDIQPLMEQYQAALQSLREQANHQPLSQEERERESRSRQGQRAGRRTSHKSLSYHILNAPFIGHACPPHHIQYKYVVRFCPKLLWGRVQASAELSNQLNKIYN